MKNTKKKGFTIVELVIVIAVIAILAAVMIPTFSNVVAKANESKALQQARAAYTNWLATGDNVLSLGADTDLILKVGTYTFYVTDGQFVGATAPSDVSGYDTYNVSGESMTPAT